MGDLLLPAVLWLGWVSMGVGCEGSVAAGCWVDGKQRQDVSLVQNLSLGTGADVPRQTILLPGLRSCPWRQSPTTSVFLLSQCLSSYFGVELGIRGLRSTLGQCRRECLWMR